MLHDVRPWNTHWGGGEVSPLLLLHPRSRAAAGPLADELLAEEGGGTTEKEAAGPQGEDAADPQWIVVAGPRRVGKTTTLGHVARQLLAAGVEPERIVAVPLDQPPVQPHLDAGIAGLIEETRRRLAPTANRPLYVLLDEVQEIEGWAPLLKAAWDRYHREVRVLATGSSAMRLIRPAEADFPGRIRVRGMYPMKFREVVDGHPDLTDHVEDEGWQRVVTAAKTARRALGAPGEDWTGTLADLVDTVASASPSLDAMLARTFREYVFWGGYPRARPGTDADLAERREVFHQAWDAVLAKDVASLDIVKTHEFERLFHRLGRHPGGKFVPHNLSSDLGPKDETIKRWKRALEDALLVQQLDPMKPSLGPSRGRSKVYLVDPGWYGYLTGLTRPEDLAADRTMGALVENVLVDHARRLQFNLAGTTDLPIGYVSDPEVDIAVQIGRRWLLIESKFGSSVGAPIERLLQRHGDAVGVVVTEDHLELGGPGTPTYVPASLWALVC